MEDEMRARLRRAMAARDRDTTSALRVALAALANAESVDARSVDGTATEVPRRELTDAQRRAVVAGVVADHPETSEVLAPYT